MIPGGQDISNYHVDGQIAQAVHGGKAENFLWDDLALVHRGETSFINEPYVTGGNPILSSKQGVMFNDMQGNTLNISGKSVSMTTFGETKDADAMFTGKPYIGELGYAFLFRNYRADKGKWLSADPLGYPDGWNNYVYVNNSVTFCIDLLGTVSYTVNNIEYTFLRWDYVSTYAIISFHNGNPDGTEITSILWNSEFNIYKPIYSIKCVDPACVDYNKSLGVVDGNAIAGASYNKQGSKNGSFSIASGIPVPGAPKSLDNLYYTVTKSRDSYPSQIPTGTAYSNHSHRPE